MKPKTYTHLSIYERDLIAVCKSQGQSLRAIARSLHRDPGTLCREIKRNAPSIRTGYYLAHKAQARADERACASRTHTRLKHDRIRRHVEGRIRKGWSPELVVGRLRTNRVLGTCSWFCEPYHSWERGTVENTIGLVRRFFPKKTDFATIATHEIRSVERWLNNRPRKCLGFKTPAEVFKAAGVALAG